MSKPALGRGLSVLLGGSPGAQLGATETAAVKVPGPDSKAGGAGKGEVGVQMVRLERIRPCAFQPRKDFPPEALRELADSIREQGIVQPLVVRPTAEGFELIAGERRWRAAQLAGLQEVPILVKAVDDRTALELALVENLQRENLNPIEEAQGFAQLIEQFALSQEGAAAKVGKSRTAVANALRLLKLADEVQRWVREGKLSVGHAKVILGLESLALQRKAAERVVQEGLSVRQAEELVDHLKAEPAPARREPAGKAWVRDPHVARLEERLRQRLGTKVQVRYRQGRGAVEIRFFSDDDLERVLSLLGITMD